jgi:uncharacterized membrane protein YdjX (TVP38/TMEM64 family)
VLLVTAALWANQRFDLASHLTVGGMRALIDASGSYGPLVFVGVCVAGILLHLPAALFIALGGLLFESTRAVAYGWIGSLLGTTGTFLLVRYLARDAFQRALIGRFAGLRALDERLERHGFVTVLILRLVLFLAPPINWAIGATRVRFHHYVGGTALGIVPGIAVTVFFADSIANRRPGDPLLSGKVLIGALLFAGFLVVSALAGRRLFSSAARTRSSREDRT